MIILAAILILIFVPLILFAGCLIYFDASFNSSDICCIGSDRRTKYTRKELIIFFIGRLLRRKMKYKIIFNHDQERFQIACLYGLRKYRPIWIKDRSEDNYHLYNSKKNAIFALKKFLNRESYTYKSKVKWFYSGDILAEMQYNKGGR